MDTIDKNNGHNMSFIFFWKCISGLCIKFWPYQIFRFINKGVPEIPILAKLLYLLK